MEHLLNYSVIHNIMITRIKNYKNVLVSSVIVVAIAVILPQVSYADRAAYNNCLDKGGNTRTCQYLLSAPATNSTANNTPATQTSSSANNSGTNGNATLLPAGGNQQTLPAGGNQQTLPAGGEQQTPASQITPNTNTNTNTSNTSGNSGGVVTLQNPLKGVNSISDLILAFMKIVSYLAVIAGVLMLMWVGLQFVMARGNPEEIKKRSNELLWIVIGIAVILGARILVSVIINTLEATGTVNSAIIQNDRSAINSQ